MGRGARGSVAAGRNMARDGDDHILKTQDIEVVTETASGASPENSDPSNASSSTAVSGPKGVGAGAQVEPSGKVSKLMGTSVSYLPGRGSRHSRPVDPANGRSASPSESEKEIIRMSSDDEKGGTWAGSATSGEGRV